MSVPTAPTVPADQMESQLPILDSKPDAPPAYSPHFVPGPPGSAVPQPGTGLPMVYYNAQQPTTYPLHQPGGTSPIQYQPGRYPAPRQTAPITWMTGPTPMPNCPPGLEFLTQLDNVHVLQHFQPIEMMINFEANNKYDVRNNENQMIYVVTEDTDDYTRNAYRGLRPFVLRVTDSMGREVMTMQRPLKCTICCYCCCPSTRQEMIYVVTEDTDDYTRNAYRGLRPFVLRVTDSMGREVMTMQRPLKCTICCYCCCPSTRQEVRGRMMINFEANNKYDVRNNENQMIYVVTEDTDDYTRNAYRGLRPFVLRVTDSMGREVMTMQRPLKCTICCYCCCPSTRQEMEVQCPPGVTIGFVREHWNLFRAIYNLQNEKKEVMMKIVGPCLSSGCCSDFVFQVKSLEGTSIGSITRKWNGLVAAVADSEHFEIRFPLNLDVKMKAMIFGACFLIDFVHFERSAQSRHHSHGHHGHRH